jgi:rhodanese-related sulfurtransferase
MLRALLVSLAALLSGLACADGAPKVSHEQLLERINGNDSELVVLDVRTAQEFAAGHVPGAINISHDELEARIQELEQVREKDVVVYCRSGRRTGIALGVLERAGFKRTYHLEGDYLGWTAAGRVTERTSP